MLVYLLFIFACGWCVCWLLFLNYQQHSRDSQRAAGRRLGPRLTRLRGRGQKRAVTVAASSQDDCELGQEHEHGHSMLGEGADEFDQDDEFDSEDELAAMEADGLVGGRHCDELNRCAGAELESLVRRNQGQEANQCFAAAKSARAKTNQTKHDSVINLYNEHSLLLARSDDEDEEEERQQDENYLAGSCKCVDCHGASLMRTAAAAAARNCCSPTKATAASSRGRVVSTELVCCESGLATDSCTIVELDEARSSTRSPVLICGWPDELLEQPDGLGLPPSDSNQLDDGQLVDLWPLVELHENPLNMLPAPEESADCATRGLVSSSSSSNFNEAPRPSDEATTQSACRTNDWLGSDSVVTQEEGQQERPSRPVSCDDERHEEPEAASAGRQLASSQLFALSHERRAAIRMISPDLVQLLVQQQSEAQVDSQQQPQDNVQQQQRQEQNLQQQARVGVEAEAAETRLACTRLDQSGAGSDATLEPDRQPAHNDEQQHEDSDNSSGNSDLLMMVMQQGRTQTMQQIATGQSGTDATVKSGANRGEQPRCDMAELRRHGQRVGDDDDTDADESLRRPDGAGQDDGQSTGLDGPQDRCEPANLQRGQTTTTGGGGGNKSLASRPPPLDRSDSSACSAELPGAPREASASSDGSSQAARKKLPDAGQRHAIEPASEAAEHRRHRQRQQQQAVAVAEKAISLHMLKEQQRSNLLPTLQQLQRQMQAAKAQLHLPERQQRQSGAAGQQQERERAQQPQSESQAQQKQAQAGQGTTTTTGQPRASASAGRQVDKSRCAAAAGQERQQRQRESLLCQLSERLQPSNQQQQQQQQQEQQEQEQHLRLHEKPLEPPSNEFRFKNNNNINNNTSSNQHSSSKVNKQLHQNSETHNIIPSASTRIAPPIREDNFECGAVVEESSQRLLGDNDANTEHRPQEFQAEQDQQQHLQEVASHLDCDNVDESVISYEQESAQTRSQATTSVNRPQLLTPLAGNRPPIPLHQMNECLLKTTALPATATATTTSNVNQAQRDAFLVNNNNSSNSNNQSLVAPDDDNMSSGLHHPSPTSRSLFTQNCPGAHASGANNGDSQPTSTSTTNSSSSSNNRIKPSFREQLTILTSNSSMAAPLVVSSPAQQNHDQHQQSSSFAMNQRIRDLSNELYNNGSISSCQSTPTNTSSLMSDSTNSTNTLISELNAMNSGELIPKLIERLDRKLIVMKKEQLALMKEIEMNETVGQRLFDSMRKHLTVNEFDKICLHANEIEKVTKLILSLKLRLRRVEAELKEREAAAAASAQREGADMLACFDCSGSSPGSRYQSDSRHVSGEMADNDAAGHESRVKQGQQQQQQVDQTSQNLLSQSNPKQQLQQQQQQQQQQLVATASLRGVSDPTSTIGLPKRNHQHHASLQSAATTASSTSASTSATARAPATPTGRQQHQSGRNDMTPASLQQNILLPARNGQKTILAATDSPADHRHQKSEVAASISSDSIFNCADSAIGGSGTITSSSSASSGHGGSTTNIAETHHGEHHDEQAPDSATAINSHHHSSLSSALSSSARSSLTSSQHQHQHQHHHHNHNSRSTPHSHMSSNISVSSHSSMSSVPCSPSLMSPISTSSSSSSSACSSTTNHNNLLQLQKSPSAAPAALSDSQHCAHSSAKNTDNNNNAGNNRSYGGDSNPSTTPLPTTTAANCSSLSDNLIMNLITDVDILSAKRNKLISQLEEAHQLEECIVKRNSIIVERILKKYYDDQGEEGDIAQFKQFTKLKSLLLKDSHDIADRIDNAELQLSELKQTNQCNV